MPAEGQKSAWLLSQERIDAAMETLLSRLTFASTSVSTHELIQVDGLANPEVLESLALYVVASAAQVIQANLIIVSDLLGNAPEVFCQLQKEIEQLIGASNSAITDDFREDHRDPFFAEVLGHLFLNMSRRVGSLAPGTGTIRALTPVHDDVKQHGFDLACLYTDDTVVGFGVSESKTSENHATNHVHSAGALFSEVESGVRDPNIRAVIGLLRQFLQVEHQQLISAGFWKKSRSFYITISYGEGSSFACTAPRPSYQLLPQKPRLVAVKLKKYREFYDGLADKVRGLVAEVC